MSGTYDNTNRGILSRNERKEKDTHADFRGNINVDGREYWLDAWVKERKDGSGKFFSLSVKPKDPPAQQLEPARQAQRGGAPAKKDDLDDLPF